MELYKKYRPSNFDEILGNESAVNSLKAMFKNNDMVRSNYVARVDQEKCVACGQCVKIVQ